LITLLVGAEEGGLEVLNRNDEWIKVQPSSNSIVCNIGDMMQLVTANKLKSTTHRVVQYVENEPTSRYSIPFFMHPSPETDLRNIFIEGSEGTLADDFLNERLKAIKLY
jgi:isopenicillin N synthase-like dioxygenase